MPLTPAPPPATEYTPPVTDDEPDIRVSDASTGQLGHPSHPRRLGRSAVSSQPQDRRGPPWSWVEVPIPLMDENITPVACRQQQ